MKIDHVVHKFGGSCLRESSDIEKIANIIHNTEGKPVVVVSALWGVTVKKSSKIWYLNTPCLHQKSKTVLLLINSRK